MLVSEGDGLSAEGHGFLNEVGGLPMWWSGGLVVGSRCDICLILMEDIVLTRL